ncbi:MAG: EamA family transporter [Nanoarchaeota archaeon]|nr:EamA family transporter [Nanoarchaeota archaeon]MBU1004299.1 EamA family transporter [Nanoarchaeota archaeon]MBU1945483.1 EamA family transporter [Nanoarchaeota archaeon]
METELWAIGLVILACFIGSFGPIMLKKASGKMSLKIKELIKNYNLILGFVFYGLGTILFIPALKGGELSVLYPLVATTYVWVSLWSIKFLGEQMNRYRWMGIGLVIVGVVFIGLGA